MVSTKLVPGLELILQHGATEYVSDYNYGPTTAPDGTPVRISDGGGNYIFTFEAIARASTPFNT